MLSEAWLHIAWQLNTNVSEEPATLMKVAGVSETSDVAQFPEKDNDHFSFMPQNIVILRKVWVNKSPALYKIRKCITQ